MGLRTRKTGGNGGFWGDFYPGVGRNRGKKCTTYRVTHGHQLHQRSCHCVADFETLELKSLLPVTTVILEIGRGLVAWPSLGGRTSNMCVVGQIDMTCAVLYDIFHALYSLTVALLWPLNVKPIVGNICIAFIIIISVRLHPLLGIGLSLARQLTDPVQVSYTGFQPP